MAVNQNYTNFLEYFEEIAIRNKMISHSAGAGDEYGSRRFFRSNLDSFIVDQTGWAASGIDGDKLILHFITPQWFIDRKPSGQDVENYEVMFFIMGGFSFGDGLREQIMRGLADKCVKQILTRIKKDSIEGNPLFKRSLDSLVGVRSTPYEYNNGTIGFTGYQVSIPVKVQFDQCYNENDWQ